MFNESLNQGLEWKKDFRGKEGLDNMFRSSPNTDQEFATVGTGTGIELDNEIATFKVKASAFFEHKKKLDDILKKCKESCDGNTALYNTANKAEGCKLGCVDKYPRWSNPYSTYVNKDDSKTGEAFCEDLTTSSTGSPAACKYGIVLNEKDSRLTIPGKGNTIPILDCHQCGGQRAGFGKRYRHTSVKVKRNTDTAEQTGGFISSDNSVNDSGKVVAGGKNLGCLQIVDDEVKTACNEKTQDYSKDINDNPITGTISTKFHEWKQANTALDDKMKKYKGDLTNFNSILKDMQSKLISSDQTIFQKIYGGDLEKNEKKEKEKRNTYKGRADDNLLKKEAQVYRNFALGILAISLAGVAIFKIKNLA
jgi:hypothetical protein